MTDTFIESYMQMQAEIPTITKNAENPHFKSKFADLATIVNTVRPILAKHGFIITQVPGYNDSGDPVLVTSLRHTSGETIVSEMLLCVAKADPQGQGSALTYARRYSLSTLLGIVTEDDDDGNAASNPIAQPHTVKREPPVRPVEAPKLNTAPQTSIGDF